jgi:hypothetical protein
MKTQLFEEISPMYMLPEMDNPEKTTFPFEKINRHNWEKSLNGPKSDDYLKKNRLL